MSCRGPQARRHPVFVILTAARVGDDAQGTCSAVGRVQAFGRGDARGPNVCRRYLARRSRIALHRLLSDAAAAVDFEVHAGDEARLFAGEKGDGVGCRDPSVVHSGRLAGVGPMSLGSLRRPSGMDSTNILRFSSVNSPPANCWSLGLQVREACGWTLPIPDSQRGLRSRAASARPYGASAEPTFPATGQMPACLFSY